MHVLFLIYINKNSSKKNNQYYALFFYLDNDCSKKNSRNGPCFSKKRDDPNKRVANILHMPFLSKMGQKEQLKGSAFSCQSKEQWMGHTNSAVAAMASDFIVEC